MKIALIVITICLTVITTIALCGGFTKINTIILTQDGRYIGIQTFKSFRLPFSSSESYGEVKIIDNGQTYFPKGSFFIYYSIEGQGMNNTRFVINP